MVPELRRALVETEARVLVVLNLAEQAGETSGYDAQDHLAALFEHAPDLQVDTVLADPSTVPDSAELKGAVASSGAELVVAHVAAERRQPSSRSGQACAERVPRSCEV